MPYKAIFNDLETVFDEITQEMCTTKSKQFSDKIRDEEIKIKKGATLSGLGQDICASGKESQEQKKKKERGFATRLREYVDLDLDDSEKRE